MKKTRLKFTGSLSIFAFCIAVFVYSSHGQSPVPTVEELEDQHHLIISKEAMQIAEEYADILKELQELTLDYSRTFSKIRYESSLPQLEELNSLIVKLANGEYLEDIDRLTNDLDDVRAKLREQELKTKEKAKYFDEDKRKETLKALKLSQSLRRDLESFDIILNEDINFRLQNLKTLTNEIQICLNQISLEELDIYLENFTKYIKIIGDSVNNIYIQNYDGDSLIFVVPEVPDVPEVSDNDAEEAPAPVPPVEIKPYSYFYLQKSGQSIATKEFTDSLKVKSSRVPIYINNPTGNLQITGWNKKFIYVNSVLEVTSTSENEASYVTNNTNLKFVSDNSGVVIEIQIPKIKNSQTSINNYELEIKVPRDNPLIGNSSYGSVSLENLENKITFKSTKSDVYIGSIIGDINITNDGGPLDIEEVEGLIEVKNNFSPISLTQCIGDIKAQNTFAAVKVTECEGDIEINNSGPINLSDNNGNVIIANTKGFIDIQKHNGDITAKNSYEPLILDDIDGAVNVINQRGIIKAQYITGTFKAVNEYAPIFAYHNEGLLDLNNTRGLIDVIWADGDEGASTITSQFGEVKLAMDEYIDLNFKAKMINGKIISVFPIKIKSTGTTQEGEYIFGDGGPTLTVNGTNSTITLNKAH
ncbi:MAG: hypothetical protein ABIJ12_10510 [bacterium]